MTTDRTLDKIVGGIIEAGRKEKGITQKKLADCVGITPVYYRNIAKGLYRPTWVIFVKICSALDIDINDLAEYIGDA